jgi:hypothetical protein
LSILFFKKLPVRCFWKLLISGSFFFFSFSFFGVVWRGPKGFIYLFGLGAGWFKWVDFILFKKKIPTLMVT